MSVDTTAPPAPDVRNFQVVTAEDGSKSLQLEVFNVQDNISGTGFIRVQFIALHPETGALYSQGNGYEFYGYMDFHPQRTSDYVPNADGYFEGSIPISEFAPDAIYKIATVRTDDLANNQKTWGNPDLLDLGTWYTYDDTLATLENYTVTSSAIGPVDTTAPPAPDVRNFQVVTAEDGSKSLQLEVFNVQDNISGTGFIRVQFIALHPETGALYSQGNGYEFYGYMDFHPQRTSDYVPNADGYFEGSIPISEFAPDAIYKIATVRTDDLANNQKLGATQI